MKIPVKCTDRFLPAYQHPGDAGADLRAATSVALLPGQKVAVGTGVKIAVPQGYVGLVLPRSGLAAEGIVAVPGTIDSGYRGEIRVVLYNFACVDRFVVHVGNRIAHLVILPVAHADFAQTEELPEGDRNEEGFGSTGMD